MNFYVLGGEITDKRYALDNLLVNGIFFGENVSNMLKICVNPNKILNISLICMNKGNV